MRRKSYPNNVGFSTESFVRGTLRQKRSKELPQEESPGIPDWIKAVVERANHRYAQVQYFKKLSTQDISQK